MSLPFGLDSNPPDDTKGIMTDTGVSGESALAALFGDFSDGGIEKGETRIFSATDTVQAFIYLMLDGSIQFDGEGNFHTKSNEMQTAFSQFTTDFNNLISVLQAAVGNPIPPGLLPTTADMSAAKADKLKTN